MCLGRSIDKGLGHPGPGDDVDSWLGVAEAFRCRLDIDRVVATAEGHDRQSRTVTSDPLGSERWGAVCLLDLRRHVDSFLSNRRCIAYA